MSCKLNEEKSIKTSKFVIVQNGIYSPYPKGNSGTPSK